MTINHEEVQQIQKFNEPISIEISFTRCNACSIVHGCHGSKFSATSNVHPATSVSSHKPFCCNQCSNLQGCPHRNPRRHRFHRHRHSPRSPHHTHLVRQAGCHHSRSHLQMFIRTRRSHLSVANAASVKRAYAVVHVITDSIGIGIRRAVPTTYAQGVKLVAVTVAVACWNVSTSALVDFTFIVANVASVKRAYTVVNIITDTSASASAVQSPHIRPRRQAGCRHSRSRLLGCLYNRTRRSLLSVAYAAASTRLRSRQRHHDSIGIGVRRAVTTTHAQGVKLVSIAVAVSSSGMSAHPHS